MMDIETIYFSIESLKGKLEKLNDKINKYIPDDEPHGFLRLSYPDGDDKYDLLYERKYQKVIKTIYKNSLKWDRTELDNMQTMRDIDFIIAHNHAVIAAWGMTEEYAV